MGYKSRSNYAIGQKVSQDHWNNIFKKEKEDEFKEGVNVGTSGVGIFDIRETEKCRPKDNNRGRDQETK